MAAPTPVQMLQMQNMLQAQAQAANQVQQQSQQQPVQPMGQPPQQHSQLQIPQEAQKTDNISKVKSLIWPLKESLASCMRIASSNISYNASVDAGSKGADQQPPRFDKSLEDFYAICDQIELNLKVALDCSNLASSSQRYTPFSVAANKPDGPGTTDSYNYSQLISTVKLQVAHAKEIHDSLTDAARTINNNE